MLTKFVHRKRSSWAYSGQFRVDKVADVLEHRLSAKNCSIGTGHPRLPAAIEAAKVT
jgi:hypothetical protein